MYVWLCAYRSLKKMERCGLESRLRKLEQLADRTQGEASNPEVMSLMSWFSLLCLSPKSSSDFRLGCCRAVERFAVWISDLLGSSMHCLASNAKSGWNEKNNC